MPYSWNLIIPSANPVTAPVSMVYGREAEAIQPDWGFDIMVLPELDMTWTPRRDHIMLADSFARRLFTPRGRLWAHPNYGFDIRDELNEVITEDRLDALRSAIEAQAEDDERIQSISVAVAYDPEDDRIEVKAALTSSAGPFSMVFSITQLSAELLLEG